MSGKPWGLIAMAGTLLAACDEAAMNAMSVRSAGEPSEAALAALPPGIDPGFLIRDSNGCYGIVIEVPEPGEPQTGAALLDAGEQQVCDS